VIREKGFTFAPRNKEVGCGKRSKTGCRSFSKKKSNFYLVIKKKGFTFAAA